MRSSPASGVIILVVFLSLLRHSVQIQNPSAYPHNPETSISTSTQQRHQPKQPRMSCYVCSTMDYASPTDNICRTLRVAGSLNYPHAQSNPGHFGHFKHSLPATTTTEASNPYDQSRLPTTEALAGSSPGPDGFGTTAISTQHDDTTNVNTTSLIPQRNTHNSSMYSQKPTMSSIPLLPNNRIDTRECMDDENFCSIVSVVRIEFAQEAMYPRFWALERNCSKSCNSGCMSIGERVRLRVCSQCCRTPNCNFGSGVGRTTSINLNHVTWIVFLGVLAIKYLANGPR